MKNEEERQNPVANKNEDEVPKESVAEDSSYSEGKTKYLLLGGLASFVIILVFVFGFMVFFRIRSHLYLRPNGARNIYVTRSFGRRDFGVKKRTFGVNHISGKVTAVNGQTFVVDTSGQTKTVQISTNTRFPLNSVTKISVNDQVLVWGLQNSDGVIQANQIAVNPSL